jgi:hypothetical protein
MGESRWPFQDDMRNASPFTPHPSHFTFHISPFTAAPSPLLNPTVAPRPYALTRRPSPSTSAPIRLTTAASIPMSLLPCGRGSKAQFGAGADATRVNVERQTRM